MNCFYLFSVRHDHVICVAFSDENVSTAVEIIMNWDYCTMVLFQIAATLKWTNHNRTMRKEIIKNWKLNRNKFPNDSKIFEGEKSKRGKWVTEAEFPATTQNAHIIYSCCLAFSIAYKQGHSVAPHTVHSITEWRFFFEKFFLFSSQSRKVCKYFLLGLAENKRKHSNCNDFWRYCEWDYMALRRTVANGHIFCYKVFQLKIKYGNRNISSMLVFYEDIHGARRHYTYILDGRPWLLRWFRLEAMKKKIRKNKMVRKFCQLRNGQEKYATICKMTSNEAIWSQSLITTHFINSFFLFSHTFVDTI